MVLYIGSVACTTVNKNLTVYNMLITCGVLKMVSNLCREVDEVREENVTNSEERQKM